ncbi:Radical SAM domain protein [Chloroherpeton thalassium ATCC 35110]|uniref:Radical SAM domain protein n=1 Tax=Chloroherpeton thalassium (strain ATCC 35110 / GB-78) TaxID=517418 RepID=B3QWJ7_CHLT3|nr:radical SAM protein [Chloroherpeton thalassium]ACF14757.1 Radical SAM domain protein [Chloroherpeton thalassium ATCC 35110]
MSNNGSIPAEELFKNGNQESLEALAAKQKRKKRWLVVQPKSLTALRTDSGHISIPLNMMMVASVASTMFDVDFIDERIGDELPADLSRYDVLAITARTLNVTKAYQIGDKAVSQGVKVILGGVHPTMMPEEAKAHCTTVVYGEIESIWEELARDILNDKMKPMYKSGELKSMTKMRQANFKFAESSPNYKKYSNLVPILATKGCPVGCSFCTTPTIYGKNFRMREVDYVIEEIKYHQNRLGKEKVSFSFMDDNICFKPNFFNELMDAMTGMGVTWNANISMNFLERPGVPELASASGCDMFSIGFESLDPDTIKQVHKGSNFHAHYEEVIKNVQKQKIAIQGYFMFGFDTDKPASFQATYDFIMQNKIEFPVFAITTPFPGTPWYDEMRPRLRHTDWEKYDTYHSVYEPKILSSEELIKNFIKIQQEVYSWRSIYKRMQGKSLNWVWFVNVAMHFFSKRLRPEMFI